MPAHAEHQLEYRSSTAQWHAERRARRPKVAKLVRNEVLREYVQQRPPGAVTTPDGGQGLGPAGPAWTGRNKPHRGDRRWVTAWSPEQIAHQLPIDFTDDASMRISHEAIYHASTSRDAVRCSASWWPACGPAGR